MLSDRDKHILDDLNRFRCLSRDDIADLYFRHLKTPIKSANAILKRLRRDGYIEVNINRRPYVYFPYPSRIQTDSLKIDHYLSIVSVYRKLMKIGRIEWFDVEPKYQHKGGIEPDIFTIWNHIPIFIEIQRTISSDKRMSKKIRMYERFYNSKEWSKLPWQRDKKVFPNVIVISPKKYNITSDLIKIKQFKDVSELDSLNVVKKQPVKVWKV